MVGGARVCVSLHFEGGREKRKLCAIYNFSISVFNERLLSWQIEMQIDPDEPKSHAEKLMDSPFNLTGQEPMSCQ